MVKSMKVNFNEISHKKIKKNRTKTVVDILNTVTLCSYIQRTNDTKLNAM